MRHIYGSRAEQVAHGQQVATKNLRRMLGHCPACGLDFAGHAYARFAVTVAMSEHEQRVNAFLTALREHRWSDAVAFREFDAWNDAYVAHALRCAGRRMVWLVVREPYELGDVPFIVEQETLDPDSGAGLENLIAQEKWVFMD